MKSKLMSIIGFCLVLGCAHQKEKPTVSPIQTGGNITVLKYKYHTGEITEITADQIKILDKKIADMLAIPLKQKNFTNTFVPFEEATSDFGDVSNSMGFMNDVSTEKDLRGEALKAEMTVSDYMVNLSTRRDIYDALVAASKNTEHGKLDYQDLRLMEQTLKGFKRSGLFLPDAELQEVRKLQQQLSKLTVDFSNNIKEQTPSVDFTLAELEGVPQDFLADLQKNHQVAGGKLHVVVNEASYPVISQNANNQETRHRLLEAFENTAAKDNTPLLIKIVSLRQEIAKKLHYKTWADYKTEERMAKNGKTAMNFLQGLKTKLAVRNKKDMASMLRFKKTLDPKADHVNPWDPRYLEYQMKKKFFALNNEEIKEYFPADQTVKNMFDIYSQILGLKFVAVDSADVWAPGVKLYEIRNSKDNTFIAYFYTDFVPREGKFSHFAAFPVISGRMKNGKYTFPVSAIVGNFAPPTEGKPSLFSHDEVETLFHEFGHIMHQSLTKARYASQSGSGVAQDFVEAPSQMLENWVWNREILKKISGHYKNPDQKLPDAIIDQLLVSRDFNKGYFYTRQLLFGIFDMTLHMATKPVDDPTALYKSLYKELTGLNPLEDTHFPATFGHLMGYDAGYYGYMWSLVYADDMFTVFEKDGLLSSKVGERYRKDILEMGDTKDAVVLVTDFLGRPSNNHAFFQKLLHSSTTAKCDELLMKALIVK